MILQNKGKYALFTCDTEFTPPWNKGSWINQERESFQSGIQNIVHILSKFNVRGTFYCQGLLVQDYPDLVCSLAEKHLIGSHGYNHENYGGQDVKVYTSEQPVFLKDKNKKFDLLSKCVEIHKKVLGSTPDVFVAPFDNIDYDLLDILEKLDFKIDSSFNNYSLGLPTQFFKPLSFNIYELPLSVIRFEKYGYKNVLQALTYDYSKIPEVLGSNIIYLTCHPYEFIEINIPHPEHVLIVGEAKVKTLRKLINDLLNRGYEFVDPLQLLEKTQNLQYKLQI